MLKSELLAMENTLLCANFSVNCVVYRHYNLSFMLTSWILNLQSRVAKRQSINDTC